MTEAELAAIEGQALTETAGVNIDPADPYQQILLLIAEVRRLQERNGCVTNVAEQLFHVLRDHGGEANPKWLDSVELLLKR